MAELLAAAAPTLVTVAAPKMLVADTVLVAKPDAGVPPLNF
jgi:hypothetical protein